MCHDTTRLSDLENERTLQHVRVLNGDCLTPEAVELPTMPTLPTGFRFVERIHAERFANEKLVGNVGIVGKSMFFPCAMRFLAARELPTLPTTFDA
jgi:hypothetical protein